jgi:photosystem II stability/assembly factor-like uncharacterized protein
MLETKKVLNRGITAQATPERKGGALKRKIGLAATLALATTASFMLMGTTSAAPNTNMIDYNKYELDAPINDMMWCGNSNEVILVLTDVGTVYRSRDRGATWKKLQNVMSQVGNEVKDQNQNVSNFRNKLDE